MQFVVHEGKISSLHAIFDDMLSLLMTAVVLFQSSSMLIQSSSSSRRKHRLPLKGEVFGFQPRLGGRNRSYVYEISSTHYFGLAQVKMVHQRGPFYTCHLLHAIH